MAQLITEFNQDTTAASPQQIENWAAIAGRWRFENGLATYLGPEDSGSKQPLGLALGSVRFLDGQISTGIKLRRNERTTAGIVLGYRSMSSPYVVAQIGGFGKAYAIAQYRPGYGWRSLADAGTLANLNVDQELEMVLEVDGQSIRMQVDDVAVLDIILDHPIEGTGLGLFAWDDAEVRFNNVSVTQRLPRIFVIMPFTEHFDTLYREVIKPVAVELDFEIIRVDEIPGPGIILDDIRQEIARAHAVVAEITTPNPNVFYELGYAHALGKPAVLLVRREDTSAMPFDVRSYRAIFYDDSIGGKKKVERNLRQHLQAVLKDA